MNSKITGLCVAAAFGAVASLGAQTTATTSSQTPHSSMSDSTETTITGCLQKGADGNYILTNARMDNSGSTSGTTASGSTGGTMTGSTGSTATTGTSGTTGSTATGATTTANRGSAGMESAATWQLSGGQDLDKHVGHRIQVTGKALGSSSSSYGSGSTATTTGSGTTATGSTTGSTATGSTATGTTGTTAETMEHQGSSSSMATSHRLDVKSVKMVSTSCS